MLRHQAREFLDNVEFLVEYLDKNLADYKIMPDRKARGCLILIAFVALIFLIVTSMRDIFKVNILFYDLSMFGITVAVVILMGLHYFFSYTYAKKVYRSYRSHITCFNFLDDFLIPFRADYINKKFIELGFTKDNIDDLINYCESKSNRKSELLWNPILIISTILLSVWGEFIGKNISEGTTNVLAFIILGLGIWVFVIYFNYVYKSLFLFKARKYRKLIQMLKIIKMLP
ncbi:hypothetical protein [Paenibacillus wulumuqiensis]|uniref:hypothetical protein n=1 Tax=Paenibacillus wulumuqiensis TaxID=1567107 RepID=UPI00061953E0|nr:hypothetical protein [Paenibacillus wulumuqiensis]